MFLIVFYHIVSVGVYYAPINSSEFKLQNAIIPSVHIGVILFVLISGYYGIKPSIKGFTRIILMVMVYYLPLQIIDLFMTGQISDFKAVRNSLMIISKTPYWFIKTYIYLYLIAPIINTFIQYSQRHTINYILLFLAIISIYFGLTGDASLSDGKNLTNFVFLYLLGNTIRCYSNWCTRIEKTWIAITYICLNIALIFLNYTFPKSTTVGYIIWRICMPYCSPLLILNATIIFLLFSKLRIQSKYINCMAGSMFAVYLIHSHPVIYKWIFIPVSVRVLYTSPIQYLLTCIAISMLIIMLCYVVDVCLSPIWKFGEIVSIKIEKNMLKHETVCSLYGINRRV